MVKPLTKWKGLNEKSVNVSKVDRNLVKKSHTYIIYVYISGVTYAYAYGSKSLNYLVIIITLSSASIFSLSMQTKIMEN